MGNFYSLVQFRVALKIKLVPRISMIKEPSSAFSQLQFINFHSYYNISLSFTFTFLLSIPGRVPTVTICYFQKDFIIFNYFLVHFRRGNDMFYHSNQNSNVTKNKHLLSYSLLSDTLKSIRQLNKQRFSTSYFNRLRS